MAGSSRPITTTICFMCMEPSISTYHYFASDVPICEACSEHFKLAALKCQEQPNLVCLNEEVCKSLDIRSKCLLHFAQLASQDPFNMVSGLVQGIIPSQNIKFEDDDKEKLQVGQMIIMQNPYTDASHPLRYQKVLIVRYISDGAHGKVFEASRNGLPIALKMFANKEDYIKEHTLYERVKNTGYNADYLDIYENDQQQIYGFTMQLLAESFEEAFAKWGRRLTREAQIRILMKVFQQLERLFICNIIHKDIKRDNMCLTPKRTDIRFVDFGEALIVKGNLSDYNHHMAKEYSDLKSLGVELYSFVAELNAIPRDFEAYDYKTTFPHDQLVARLKAEFVASDLPLNHENNYEYLPEDN